MLSGSLYSTCMGCTENIVYQLLPSNIHLLQFPCSGSHTSCMNTNLGLLFACLLQITFWAEPR
jgi:hypothetical protein